MSSSNISNLNIRVFAEDSSGQVWIGTERGLNRYTGKEFYLYFNEEDKNTINNNTIDDIMLSSDGILWFATSSGPAWHTDDDDFHRVAVRAEVGYRAASKLVQLPSGDILMANAYGQFFRYHAEEDVFLPLEPASGNRLPSTTRFFPGTGSSFWIVSSDILCQADCHGSILVRNFPYPVADMSVSTAAMDDKGRIWIQGRSDILCFDTTMEQFVPLPQPVREWLDASVDRIVHGIHSVRGYVILRDENGAWFYDLDGDKLISQFDSETPYSLPSFRATVFYMDSARRLWVGSAGHGFEICSGQEGLFNRNAGMLSSLRDVNVLSLDADASDGMWIVATENRIFHVSRSGAVTPVDNRHFLGKSTSENDIRFVCCDRERGWIWVTTRSSVFLCTPSRDGLRIVRQWEEAPYFSTTTVGADGTLYAGASQGRVFAFHPEESRSPEIVVQLQREIRDIHLLRSGKYAILSMMADIALYDPTDGSVETIVYRDQLGELFHMLDVCEDGKGNLWFATRNYGLVMMSVADGSFKFVPGTTCEWIQSLEVDQNDHIWVSSSYGLNMVIPSDENIVQYYDKDGIGGNQFNVRASCQLSDGTIVFGGTHGLTTCHRMGLDNQKTIPLLFEEFCIDGDPVSPRDGKFSGLLQHCPKVTLRHYENNISIGFAALAYSRPLAVLYEYKLDGYDKNWTFLGNENRAYYSSLPPGRYVFTVRAGSLDEAPTTISLPIRIKPPLAASPTAFLFYCLLLGMLAFFIVRSIKRRLRLNLEMEQVRREKEHEQLVNKINMNFFADMAHEFRSPLTMIQGPMSQLLEDRTVGAENHKLLSVMDLSVGRMARLVDELLNFNKLDNGKLTLSVVREVDIISRLSKAVEMAWVTAKRRGVSLQTFGFDTPFRLPLDADKFDSILSNLMSNALKYAGNNGEAGWVEVRFLPGEEQVRIQVDNNSRPFSKEELSRIFDRYYQIREHAEHVMTPGTGIGLNFAYLLALRMHGSLQAENLPGKTGVRFTLTLPVGEDAFSEDEFVSYVENPGPVTGPVREEEELDEKESTIKPYTILVVDDDVDIANYLSILLSPYYNVLVAYDVTGANEVVLSSEMPDVILSDIVMPGEDGISFCQSIKNNILTCHIPVILVTAKVGVSNEVAGLESGADAYVTKPFDPVYMLALIRSMLKNRSLLKGELAKSTSVAEVRGDLLSPRDATFLEQLYGIMEEEMANPELDVQKICDKMCVSRTKLFYKVKSLTGMSAATIFRTFRLNMAAKMLREGNDNVSEVAYKVGFNSPSYFTRAFKAQFGVLPKDIAKS